MMAEITSRTDITFVLIGVFFFGGLTLAIVAQTLWTRRQKNRRGFPIDPNNPDP